MMSILQISGVRKIEELSFSIHTSWWFGCLPIVCLQLGSPIVTPPRHWTAALIIPSPITIDYLAGTERHGVKKQSIHCLLVACRKRAAWTTQNGNALEPWVSGQADDKVVGWMWIPFLGASAFNPAWSSSLWGWRGRNSLVKSPVSGPLESLLWVDYNILDELEICIIY